MMRPLLLGLLSLAACSRSSSRPAPQPGARVEAARAAAAAPNAAALAEAREREEIMERSANLSRFPATDEGARAFVTELTRAAIARDHERVERASEELRADNARFELGLTFEGARALRDRVVPTLEPRVEALRERLGALREPLTVSVSSALGSELADGEPHGFDPRIATVRTLLRPMVRYYRAEVVGAQGSGRVVIEPMAWLGGRWTWLGEPWTAVTPTTPSAPTTPPTAAR